VHITVRGIRLNLETSEEGPPLLLLHGFAGSAASWSSVLGNLRRDCRCLAIDLPGHGQSEVPEDWRRYVIQECVADLIAVLDSLSIEKTAIAGYSMGGRVALSLAIAHPDRVTALICESSSPGLEDEKERRRRLADDERLAQMIETNGVNSFVDYWENLPIFASQQSLPAATREQIRATRLGTEPRGAANSLRGLSQGRQPPLWDQLAALSVPTIIVAGKDDEKYREIAIRMHTMIKDASLALIPKSGHAVHIEQPAPFAAVVLDFLQRIPTDA
jgi:2-succinyl-6-hydroxy-2,4-cyclohexadiene-1-carboxylate synthase